MFLVLFGMSGIGKSTLARGLQQRSPNLFTRPRMLTTRPRRASDDEQEMEFLNPEEYLAIAAKGLLVDMRSPDGSVYYGYRAEPKVESACPILLGSPYVFDQFLLLPGAIKVLLIGDPNLGLALRNDTAEYRKKREIINRELHDRFYGRSEFCGAFDLILQNEFVCQHEFVVRCERAVLEYLR